MTKQQVKGGFVLAGVLILLFAYFNYWRMVMNEYEMHVGDAWELLEEATTVEEAQDALFTLQERIEHLRTSGKLSEYTGNRDMRNTPLHVLYRLSQYGDLLYAQETLWGLTKGNNPEWYVEYKLKELNYGEPPHLQSVIRECYLKRSHPLAKQKVVALVTATGLTIGLLAFLFLTQILRTNIDVHYT